MCSQGSKVMYAEELAVYSGNYKKNWAEITLIKAPTIGFVGGQRKTYTSIQIRKTPQRFS